jgi:hypothetical protein
MKTNIRQNFVWLNCLAVLLIGHAPLHAAVIVNSSALNLSAKAGVHIFPVEKIDTDSDSQGITLNSLKAKAFLRDESGSDFAAAFSHAQASWLDANSGLITFQHGWSTSIQTGGEVSGVGVNTAPDTGWSYDFTLSNDATFAISYLMLVSGSDTLGMPLLSIYQDNDLLDTVSDLKGGFKIPLEAGSHSIRIRTLGGLTGPLGERDALQETNVNWQIVERNAEEKPDTKPKPAVAPEPASLAMFLGLACCGGLAAWRQRRNEFRTR